MRSVRWLVTFSLLLLGAPAGAVSLGEINVKSTLNQQFLAEIPVTGIPEKKNLGLQADIASAAAFQRAGLRRESLYDDMKVDLIPGLLPDEARIILKSKKRIGEPFLSFLVELRWVGGSVVREYTVLLDPPTYKPSSPNVAAANAAQERESPLGEYTKPRSGASAGATRYGPVGSETLWRVALKTRHGSSVTMDQMMLAIYEANPQAFDGDINHIRRGAYLNIPGLEEVRRIDPATATAKVRGHAAVTRTRAAPARPRPRPEPAVLEPAYTPPAPAPVKTVETPAVVSPPPASAAGVDAPPSEAVTPESTVATAPATPKTPPPTLAPDSAPPAPVASGVDPEPTTPAAAPTEPTTNPASATGGVDPEESPAPPIPAEDIAETETAPSAYAEDASRAAVDAASPAAVESAPPAQVEPAVVDTGDGLALIKPLLLLVALAVAGLLGLRYYRQRRAKEEAEAEAAVAQMPEFASADLESSVPAAASPMWQGGRQADEIAAPVAAVTAKPAGTPRAPALDLDELFATPPPSAAITRTATSAMTAGGGAGTTAEIGAQDIPVKDTDFIGEAELHIAYGLYDEAAAVLERGVQENPKRNDLWMKLLDVYAEAKSGDDYVAAAERFRQQGQPSDAEWQKVTAQGAVLAPGAVLGTAPASAAPAPPVRAEQASAPAKSTPVSEALEFDLSQFDLPSAPADSTAQPASSMASKTEGLDIDLSGFDLGAPVEAEPIAATAKPAVVDEASLADSLEFTLDAAPPAPAASADLAALDALSSDLKPAAVGDDEESGVKLDLARAYLDMGEADMAKGLLEEVVKAGSTQQRTEAKDLLARV